MQNDTQALSALIETCMKNLRELISLDHPKVNESVPHLAKALTSVGRIKSRIAFDARKHATTTGAKK